MSKTSPTKSLNIYVHCMDGVGHLNSVIGLSQALLQRGHRITFLLHSNRNELESYGFSFIQLTEQIAGEDEMRRAKMGQQQAGGGVGMLSGASSLEKMKMMSSGMLFKPVVSRAIHFFGQIATILEKQTPDLFLLDHVFIPPVLLQRCIPYVLVFSANPLLIYNSPKLPPVFSGYPTTSDPASWEEFRTYSDKFLQSQRDGQLAVNAALSAEQQQQPPNYPNYPIPYSPYLNIYGFPAEWDYRDIVQLPENVIAVDTFCRSPSTAFTLPEKLQPLQPTDKLIYLSLGSMASNDVALMRRLTSLLGKTSYKCIISKGKRASEYELPDNCWGEAYLPQTSILPLVDLVITHSGNNTVTETFSFGKPMILLPFFADQYCNAQRIAETGYGIRLETHSFTDEQFLGAIEKLLHDGQLKEKLATAVKRMEATNYGKDVACTKMEQLVRN